MTHCWTSSVVMKPLKLCAQLNIHAFKQFFENCWTIVTKIRKVDVSQSFLFLYDYLDWKGERDNDDNPPKHGIPCNRQNKNWHQLLCICYCLFFLLNLSFLGVHFFLLKLTNILYKHLSHMKLLNFSPILLQTKTKYFTFTSKTLLLQMLLLAIWIISLFV